MSAPDTKTRILTAAEQVVLERGVPALTLDAVAEAAGLSKGGLIYHFESKEALIRAMIARIGACMQERMDRLTAADAQPVALLGRDVGDGQAQRVHRRRLVALARRGRGRARRAGP